MYVVCCWYSKLCKTWLEVPIATTNDSFSNGSLVEFIWKNAEDLCGVFKHIDFGKVILPFTLLRQLECVLEPTRDALREAYAIHQNDDLDLDLILRQITRFPFYNTSAYTLSSLGGTKTRQNLQDYVAHFSDNARVIFEQFDFTNTIIRLDNAGLLFKICSNFAAIDLDPAVVADRAMSNLYEHLIRRFGAEVNEGAEDFMTPRDVVHLATALFGSDDALFECNPGLIPTLYDPTCGTGGFLTDAMDHVADYGHRLQLPPVLVPYRQELEPETDAVCVAGMLLRTLESDLGRDLSQNIKLKSMLFNDQFPGERFHYGLSNPLFGKKWEKDQDVVAAEHRGTKFDRPFGPGLPRINDGSMLFLLHLVSKLELPENGGSCRRFCCRALRCLMGARVLGNPRFGAGFLKTISLKPLCRCLRKSFSEQKLTPICGFSRITSRPICRGRSSSSTQRICGRRLKTKGINGRMINNDQRHQIVAVYSAAQNNEQIGLMQRSSNLACRELT